MSTLNDTSHLVTKTELKNSLIGMHEIAFQPLCVQNTGNQLYIFWPF